MPDHNWTPDARPIQQEFSSAVDHTEPVSELQPAHDPVTGITTQAELQKLEAGRPISKPELTLTLGGTTQLIVDDKIRKENELRTAYLKRSLDRAGRTLQRDFDRSR